MTTQFTPGPWKRNNYTSGWTINTYANNPIPIATVNSKNEEAEANARLIEAAPELLKIVERMDTVLRGVGPLYASGDLANEVGAAIAKARGNG